MFRELLEKELESVGIRLNKRKPNIYFKVMYIIWYIFNYLCQGGYVCIGICLFFC